MALAAAYAAKNRQATKDDGLFECVGGRPCSDVAEAAERCKDKLDVSIFLLRWTGCTPQIHQLLCKASRRRQDCARGQDSGHAGSDCRLGKHVRWSLVLRAG